MLLGGGNSLGQALIRLGAEEDIGFLAPRPPEQGWDAASLTQLLDDTRPDAVIGDKAYSSRAIRAELRSRGVKVVIPQPSDQIAHRKKRGSAGGRPPAFDPNVYKGRNVIERSFNDHKQWRGIATRYDKLATVYRGAVVLRAITIWLTT